MSKSSVSKHLNILRKLKYCHNCTNVDKLYLVYHFLNIHVNYGITVGLEIHKHWNNFNWKLPELLQVYLFLQKLKLYIKRQVGIIFCETEEKETSTFFYNIVNKNTPNYLCTLILPTIQSTSVYPLRNGNYIILPFYILSSTSDSFIPSTI
jgi:hypothetical protein